MAIIDAISLVAMIPAVAATLDGPILELGIGWLGAFVSFALIGVEFGSEWLSHKFWENIKGRIKEIAEAKLQEESAQPVSNDTSTPATSTTSPAETEGPLEEGQGWRTNLFAPSPTPA